MVQVYAAAEKPSSIGGYRFKRFRPQKCEKSKSQAKFMFQVTGMTQSFKQSFKTRSRTYERSPLIGPAKCFACMVKAAMITKFKHFCRRSNLRILDILKIMTIQVITESEIRLRDSLEHHGIQATLIEPSIPTPTVLDAARALGVEPSDIIKSVAFESKNGTVVLVVAPGDRRIDTNKVAQLVGFEKLKMASSARVLEVTAGGVPPVGHPEGLRVILDATLLEREELIGGGGSERLLLRIAPAEVVRATSAMVGDVCI
jgi:prolyl-tRNA editing enzyme YbaK/EbsC (Cys-tRNA(Pro) deacylase)